MPKPPEPAAAIGELSQQEAELRFARFDYADAWAVGSRIVQLATSRQYSVAASIYFGEQQVFHAALTGSSADNDGWLRRKIALVRRFDASSLLVTARMGQFGIESAEARFGLDPQLHTLSGGAFPLRVSTSLVGVVAVSGLTDQEDHDLVVEVLREHLTAQ
jgi:uncharacterized protein (UPF0303 family)